MNGLDIPMGVGWRSALVACVGAFALQAAMAADKPPPAKSAAPAKAAKREGTIGGGTGSGPFLSKDELRACMTEQDRMKKETTDVVATQQQLAKDRAEIDRLTAELDAERPKVDVSNKEAVDAFNARLQDKGKKVSDYQATAQAFNQRVDKLDADDKAFAKSCKDRRYFEDEYDAIKAGK